jgi:hypothetical protein
VTSKQDKLSAAVKAFKAQPTAILLWPSDVALSKDKIGSYTQVLYLGEPSGPSTGKSTLVQRPIDDLLSTATWILASSYDNICVILSQNELSSKKKATQKAFQGRYNVDESSVVCNERGEQSPLHPMRTYMRGRLSDMCVARFFYTVSVARIIFFL